MGKVAWGKASALFPFSITSKILDTCGIAWLAFQFCESFKLIKFMEKKINSSEKSLRLFALPWSEKTHTVFPRKLFFFEFNLMYCDLWWQYRQVRKLFKGGNYSRAETIRGNTVLCLVLDKFKTMQLPFYWKFIQKVFDIVFNSISAIGFTSNNHVSSIRVTFLHDTTMVLNNLTKTS